MYKGEKATESEGIVGEKPLSSMEIDSRITNNSYRVKKALGIEIIDGLEVTRSTRVHDITTRQK
jgi:hypothetical protein